MEYIIVALIVCGALALAFFRVLYRPACSCGCSSCGEKKRGSFVDDPLAEKPTGSEQ
jgi:hypothetical protein